MGFELKAEYAWRTADGSVALPSRRVLLWHIVPSRTALALCGRTLAAAAETLPVTAADTLPRGDLCLRCSAAHQRDPRPRSSGRS